MSELSTAEQIAMFVGGGLVAIGTLFVGLVEMLAGSGHPVESDGQIVHEALLALEIRSYIILAGFIIWGAYAVYRVATATPTVPEAESA